jgi:hypothetical protein
MDDFQNIGKDMAETVEDVKITWDKATQEKFEKMVEKIPVFLRDIARQKVARKAERLVRKENRLVVGEKDLVEAFFAETPFGFHGPMKNDMNELHIDYRKYGYLK